MSTAIAKRESASKFEMIIDGSAERLKAAMPEHFTPAKLAQVLSIIAFKTPKLSQCVPESIITSIITAGSLGLDLTPALGECYLIPRFNKDLVVNGAKGALECQCQPGYHGLKKLAMQTGEIAYIDPRVVRMGEVFRVAYDPELTFFHEPKFDDKATITHVYCVTKLTNGERKIEVMTKDQIEAIRKRSKSEGFSPWESDWPEMAKKTVFKRQSKYLPRSLKLAEAIELDNLEYRTEEDDRTEHLAINHDNQTGHGSGAYAAPQTVDAYRDWQRAFCEDKNALWTEKWTDARGQLDDRIMGWKNGELINPWQLAGHLVKWARGAELIKAPEKHVARQADQLAAVAWDRFRDQVEVEATSYVRAQWKEIWAKLHMTKVERPGPEPEDESQDGPTVDDVLDDAFPEGRE